MDYYGTAYELPAEHSHVVPYATLGLSLLSVLILLLMFMGMFVYNNTNNTHGVVPALIKDKQDLNNALKAYDNPAVDSTVKAGLNQNSQDVSQFSQ